jgi:hypothetical protein
MQDDQNFGVIVIDDASDTTRPSELAEALAWLSDRLTLVRNSERRGRMANEVMAIRELCVNPASTIVVVDLDDALADSGAIARIGALARKGHDVVLGAPFRPDGPTKVYRPDFERPRETYGGDVWIHLRVFRKSLFDLLPDDALQLDGQWLEECTDFGTMVPIVELSHNPIYVPEYLYWHERFTSFDAMARRKRDEIIKRILEKSPVARLSDASASASQRQER